MYEDSWLDEQMESRLMGETEMGGNPQDLFAEEIDPDEEGFFCFVCESFYRNEDDAAECEESHEKDE